MNTASPPAGRLWPRRLIRIGLWFLGGAIVLLIVDGPLYRMGIMPLVPALLLLVLAIILSLISFALLVTGVLAARATSSEGAGLVALVGLVVCTAMVMNFALLVKRGLSAPPIHDVSTDLDDPPDFADVVPLREKAGALNPHEYVREAPGRKGATINVPEAQRKAYPDIQTARLQMFPSEAFEAADRAARKMGWDIVASVPSEGRIEATDTSRYFGFKDDVSIRVRADGPHSKVDVRSNSRVGVGDVGVNAARIRDYLEELEKK